MDQKSNSLNGHIQPLIQESYTEVSYDALNNIIVTRWKGALTVEQVRKTLEFKAAFIQARGISYNLNDHTDLKALSPEVQQYLLEEGHVAMERSGLRKIAVKLARDIFAQATVRRVNQSEKCGELEIKVFPSYEEAYSWLLSEQ